MKNSVYLDSKPRYEILDGLRGVAALIVVAYHLFETYSGTPIHQIINHGYLAVDFFFALSGFVIGYAYDDRWDKMSLGTFFKRRLVRLHPMVIMGTLIGGCLFYLGESSAFPLIEKTSWWVALSLVVVGCLMIPVGVRWDIRGWTEVNSFNGPTWSLMWEYFANFLYAVLIRRFSRILLLIFVLVASFFTVDLALNLDIFGVFSQNRESLAYTVIGGWSLTPQQLYIGVTRLLYPFFMGLLLSRVNKLIKIKDGFWWCSLLIVIVLSMPRVGGEKYLFLNGIYEAFCILFMFPIIVSIGAGSTISSPHTIRICKFLGEISYPLYITHFPLIYLQIAFASNHPEAALGQIIFVSVGIYILSIALAYASLRLYDVPVREWLKMRWLKKKDSSRVVLEQ